MNETTIEGLWHALLRSEPGAQTWHYGHFVRDGVPDHICDEAWRLTLEAVPTVLTLRDVASGCSRHRKEAAQIIAEHADSVDLGYSVNDTDFGSRAVAEATLEYLESLNMNLWSRIRHAILRKPDPRRTRCNWALSLIMEYFPDLRDRSWQQLRVGMPRNLNLIRALRYHAEARDEIWLMCCANGVGCYELQDIAEIPELEDLALQYMTNYRLPVKDLLNIAEHDGPLQGVVVSQLFEDCNDPSVYAEYFQRAKELDEDLWETFLALEPGDDLVVRAVGYGSAFANLASEELIRRNCKDPEHLAYIIDYAHEQFKQIAMDLLDMDTATRRTLWRCVRGNVRGVEAGRALIMRFDPRNDALEEIALHQPELRDLTNARKRPHTEAVMRSVRALRRSEVA